MRKIFITIAISLFCSLLIGNGFCFGQTTSAQPALTTTTLPTKTLAPASPVLFETVNLNQVTPSTSTTAGTETPTNTVNTSASSDTTQSTTTDSTAAGTTTTQTESPVTTTTSTDSNAAGTSTTQTEKPVTNTSSGGLVQSPTNRAPTGTRIIPPSNDIRQPPAEVPDCPTVEPVSNQVPCQKTETIPVIPKIPYILIITPLAGVLIFWLIFYGLANQQKKIENNFTKNHLVSLHGQTIKSQQTRLYRDILESFSSSLSIDSKISADTLQKFSSKIELLGSPEMKTVHKNLLAAYKNGNRDQLKQALKTFTLQIKKEL